MQCNGMGCLTAAALCVITSITNDVQAAPKLTLQQAIMRAEEQSPRLKAVAATMEASRAARYQADRWVNPELGLMTENVGGSGIYRGTGAAETTLGLSQRIEIGGKRSSRAVAADKTVAIRAFEGAIAHATLIQDIKIAYYNAVAAEEMLALADEQKSLARELSDEVRERVQAAREPVIQSSKTAITLATAEMAAMRAVREAQHTRHILSSMWGGHKETYTLDTTDFFQLTSPGNEKEVDAKIEDCLDLHRMKAVESLGKAHVVLEKANAVPDPTLTAGVRELGLTDEHAFMVGLSIPIPVLNNNQGNIARARAEASKAEIDTQEHILTLRNKAFEALESMTNTYEHADRFDHTILPAAEKAFQLARQGYRAGKFPYLEVLDAQRTLFAVREQRIATLQEYHAAKATLERLTTPASVTRTKENTDEE